MLIFPRYLFANQTSQMQMHTVCYTYLAKVSDFSAHVILEFQLGLTDNRTIHDDGASQQHVY